MGIVWSMCNIMEESLGGNETIVEEYHEEGRGPVKRTITRKNPYIVTVATISASMLLIIYMDNGNGCITKTFGKKCINCDAK